MTFKSDAVQSAELEQLLAHAMSNSIVSTAARFMTDQPCDSSVFGAFSFSPLCESSVNEDSLSVGTYFPMKSEVKISKAMKYHYKMNLFNNLQNLLQKCLNFI